MDLTSETRMTQEPGGGATRQGYRSARAGRFDPEVLLGIGVEDPILMEEILITFLVASTDVLRDMFHQQRLGDLAGLAAGAARLQDVALAVGARRLAACCATLAGLAEAPPDREREVRELFLLDRELDLAQAAIRSYLQGWLPA